MKYQSFVLHGDKQGRLINFPTINLDPTVIPAETKQGVYHAIVGIGDKTYHGALYYGPRFVLSETTCVLEIHILDFNEEIYGQKVSFTFKEFIREPEHFSSFEILLSAIKQDIETIRNLADKKNP